MTEPDDEKALIQYINEALDKPLVHPEDDLGIPLPAPGPRAQLVRGLPVEEISEPRPKYQPLPQPPYRCRCGTKFETAEDLLAHRHPDEKRLPRYSIPEWHNLVPDDHGALVPPPKPIRSLQVKFQIGPGDWIVKERTGPRRRDFIIHGRFATQSEAHAHFKAIRARDRKESK